MYTSLDISALLKVVRHNNVKNPLNNKPSGKYKVKSKEFCAELIVLCGNLLEAERVNLGLVDVNRSNNAGVVPLYFQKREYKEENDESSRASVTTSNDSTVPSLDAP